MPTVNLSSQRINKAEAGSKPYELRDTKLPGFILRVQPTGRKTFYCEYARGKRVKIGVFTQISLANARERAREVLADAFTGGDPAFVLRKRRQAITYKDFLDKHYLPWSDVNHTVPRQTRNLLYKNFEEFMTKKISSITLAEVERWRVKMLKTSKSNDTLNRKLGVFRSSFNKAVEWDIIASNPLVKMKMLRSDGNEIVRYLSVDEERSLVLTVYRREEMARAKRVIANRWRRERNYPLLPDLHDQRFIDHMRPMIILALNTGMRKSEIFKLKWRNVDFGLKQVTVEAKIAKSKKVRHIPLNADALRCLKDWKEENNYPIYVFESKSGKPFNNVQKAWSGILKDAKIEGFRWHDMRHHFASKLVMAGVSLNTVRELLGHSNYKMTLRYAHLSPGHKADAVALLEH